ncbi:division plane positioning ATPase MipZ, partial [Rothia aeria]
PTHLIPSIPQPRHHCRAIPTRIITNALAEAATAEERFMILLGAHAGLRRSEIAALHTQDYTNGWLHITGKGGTSKSTLAVNLAVEYHRQGSKVIILETDPTVSTASQWAADRENSDQPGITTVRKTGRLGNTIDDLAAAYDAVIIDTAGKDSTELRSAAHRADLLLVPTSTSVADLDTTRIFLSWMDEARDMNPKLQMLVVISKAPTWWHSNHVEIASEALAEIPEDIEFSLADTVIYHRNIYAQALSEGLSVIESDNPKAKAEIQLLAQEITNLLTTAEEEEN